MSLGFTLWNMEDGFVDALVRGWRSGFLSDLEYTNLKEGESCAAPTPRACRSCAPNAQARRAARQPERRRFR